MPESKRMVREASVRVLDADGLVLLASSDAEAGYRGAAGLMGPVSDRLSG